MKKAVIWGVGKTAQDFIRKKVFYKEYEIIAFVDNSYETRMGICSFLLIIILHILWILEGE